MHAPLKVAATLQLVVAQRWRYWLSPRPPTSTGREATWLSELGARGYVVVPDFLSRAECEGLVAEYHRLEQDYPRFVQHRSDSRVFGANRVSRPIRAFAEHPALVHMAKAAVRSSHTSCLTLSQHLVFSPGNLGSGEGWHRDSYSPQFKSILYLSDVGEENGPFQIVPGSHNLRNVAVDTVLQGVESGRKRFTSDEVEQIVRRRYPEGITTATGKAGTLLLAMTTALHRGKPIEAGERYALTNYFFAESKVPAWAEKHFGAIPPELAVL